MLNSFAGTSWIFLKLHPDKIQSQFESVDSRGILDKFALCLSVGEWQNWEFLQRKKKPRFEVFYRGHSNIWWDIMEGYGREEIWRLGSWEEANSRNKLIFFLNVDV